jgi:hypothetical protein
MQTTQAKNTRFKKTIADEIIDRKKMQISNASFLDPCSYRLMTRSFNKAILGAGSFLYYGLIAKIT